MPYDFFNRRSKKDPSLFSAEEQAQMAEQLPTQGVDAASSVAAPAAAASGPSSGTMAAIGVAGQAAGQAADPEGTGLGPAISGAASGAATGATVGGPYGAVIGAAIGLGLGVMSADRKRAALKQQGEAAGLAALAQGGKNAADALTQVRFKFGQRSGRYRK